jgi:hypothetical protein
MVDWWCSAIEIVLINKGEVDNAEISSEIFL